MRLWKLKMTWGEKKPHPIDEKVPVRLLKDLPTMRAGRVVMVNPDEATRLVRSGWAACATWPKE